MWPFPWTVGLQALGMARWCALPNIRGHRTPWQPMTGSGISVSLADCPHWLCVQRRRRRHPQEDRPTELEVQGQAGDVLAVDMEVPEKTLQAYGVMDGVGTRRIEQLVNHGNRLPDGVGDGEPCAHGPLG